MPRKTLQQVVARHARGGASMRPRPDAAENAGCGAAARGSACGFNEAAARCRGKRPLNLHFNDLDSALQ